MTYWQPLQWGSVEYPPPQGLLPYEQFVGVALNSLYTVWVYSFSYGEDEVWHHLSIKRFDKAACRDWRHFQWIKNEVCGAEREAIEVFPAESRLLDAANQYHLWVLPEGHVMRVGVGDRAVADEFEMLQLDPNVGQRKFDQPVDRYLGHVGLLHQLEDQ